MPSPRVRSPLKYFGGKSYLAPKVVALMPPCRTYVEPFLGGGSVLLARPPEGAEVANDLDGHLATFWSVLRDERLFELFRRRCEATAFSERDWGHACILLDFPNPVLYGARDWIEGVSPDTTAVLTAWAVFVRSRMSLSGRGVSHAPISRTRSRRGMQEQVSAWLTAVEGLPAVHERLRRVRVTCRDALELVAETDDPETLFYLDPPYHPESRAAGGYAVDFDARAHERLLALVVTLKGKVILSGYHGEAYDRSLAGWTRHEHDQANHSSGTAVKRRMTECLWTNF
jgi:DNA adenine methylase